MTILNIVLIITNILTLVFLIRLAAFTGYTLRKQDVMNEKIKSKICKVRMFAVGIPESERVFDLDLYSWFEVPPNYQVQRVPHNYTVQLVSNGHEKYQLPVDDLKLPPNTEEMNDG